MCRFHGARSSGPTTEEGRLRIARGKVKHGDETRQARADRSKKLAELAQLEDLMHVSGLTVAPRTRGRKPAGYRPIKTTQEAVEFVIRQFSQPDTAVSHRHEKFKRKTP